MGVEWAIAASAPTAWSKLTRREALALGAAAGMTATVGDPGSALASSTIGGMGTSGPAYLRRSTYVDLVGQRFTVGGTTLELVAVEDVLGAETDERLVGHDAAFTLLFTGVVDALPSSLYEVRHDLLGPFPLFLGPMGAARGLTQHYDAVVDRTVRVKYGGTPGPPQAIGDPVAAAGSNDSPEDERAPAAPPSERDLQILEQRAEAVRATRVRRRRRARRARARLRRMHDDRVTFLRKQRRAARKRARKIRAGWLRRHG